MSYSRCADMRVEFGRSCSSEWQDGAGNAFAIHRSPAVERRANGSRRRQCVAPPVPCSQATADVRIPDPLDDPRDKVIRPALFVLFRIAIGPSADYYGPRFLAFERAGHASGRLALARPVRARRVGVLPQAVDRRPRVRAAAARGRARDGVDRARGSTTSRGCGSRARCCSRSSCRRSPAQRLRTRCSTGVVRRRIRTAEAQRAQPVAGSDVASVASRRYRRTAPSCSARWPSRCSSAASDRCWSTPTTSTRSG